MKTPWLKNIGRRHILEWNRRVKQQQCDLSGEIVFLSTERFPWGRKCNSSVLRNHFGSRHGKDTTERRWLRKQARKKYDGRRVNKRTSKDYDSRVSEMELPHFITSEYWILSDTQSSVECPSSQLSTKQYPPSHLTNVALLNWTVFIFYFERFLLPQIT